MEPVAYDENGQPLYLYHTVVIAPAEHIECCRHIAAGYIREVEEASCTEEQMLTTAIGENGVITQYVCDRVLYTQYVDAIVDWIKDAGFEWCADREYTVEDNIFSKLCLVRITLPELLQVMGKVVISG